MLGAEARRLRASGTDVVILQPTVHDLDVMGTNLMSGARRHEVIERATAERHRAPARVRARRAARRDAARRRPRARAPAEGLAGPLAGHARARARALRDARAAGAGAAQAARAPNRPRRRVASRAVPEPLPPDPAGLPGDPLQLLQRWLDEATATGMTDANAMTLATAGADGRPSARTVLLRGVAADGLRWYTNRESLKGRQLAENPRAQLLFYWRELGRQILVHGAVARDDRRGLRRLLRQPPARLADRRVGLAPGHRHRRPRRAARAAWTRRTPSTPARTCRARRTGAATC